MVAWAGADPSDVSRYFRRNVKLRLTAYRSRLRLLRFIEEVDRHPSSLLAAALDFRVWELFAVPPKDAFRGVLGCSPRAFFAGPARDAMSGAVEPFQSSVSGSARANASRFRRARI